MGWRRWAPMLAAIVVAAGAARGWRLSHLELQHWDEGAYALGGQWLVTAGRQGEPMPPFYAPPLFPVAVAFSFGLFGVSAPAAIAVSVVAGIATVPVLFFLVRQVWGAAAGLIGAVFLATCEYHLIYSRMALTDVTFVFLLLVALVCYVRAIRTGRLVTYAAAGVLTGLCQNTKYHGVFVLVIVGVYLGAGWLVGLVRRRADRARIWRQAAGLLVALAITLALYVPWALLVEKTVGYRTLLAHTQRFTSLWGTSPRWVLESATRFTAPSVLVLAAVGAVVGLASRRPQARLIVLALAALTLAPTAYVAYPRLLLPAATLACGLGGVGVVWLFGLTGARRGRRLWRLRIASAVVLTVWIGADAMRRAAPALTAPVAGYRRAADVMSALPLDQEGAELWTDAHHCLRFYLSREMRERITRVRGNKRPRRFIQPQPVVRYLVTDVRVLRHRSEAAWFLTYLDALDRAGLRVRSIENPLNDVTLLNTLSFGELRSVQGDSTSALGRRALQIAIYRIPAGWAAP